MRPERVRAGLEGPGAQWPRFCVDGITGPAHRVWLEASVRMDGWTRSASHRVYRSPATARSRSGALLALDGFLGGHRPEQLGAGPAGESPRQVSQVLGFGIEPQQLCVCERPALPPPPCTGRLILPLSSSATLGAAAISAPPECGRPQRLDRVVGGQDSGDAEWPWVVSIRKNGTHHCAGSLLTRRWVVTAAHCFKGYLEQLSLFSVLLGAWKLGSPGPRAQRAGIAWVLPHPRYSWKEAAGADIALVRLDPPVQFSERVLPICLPDASVRLPPHTQCWIAGWGSIRDGVPLPHPQTLQKLRVPIIDSGICSLLYWRGAGQEAITEDMLCAGYLEGQRDACLGDSGGPLVCEENGRWYQVGVVSWGQGCGRPRKPGVYTNVSQHFDWIQTVIQGVEVRRRLAGLG
ncbi:PREDICTED: brain-specific serine protease 4-like [Dipodomys ordii]|uniref:Brain-specific serine protease 4-like n=1 Tax=Dipodomys ordii TaxID=10020 RepID=A0A1S3EQM3_DIPOR|nr:PREDICTED: brain-specific serine protease 4-like [Dipodomys ordii]